MPQEVVQFLRSESNDSFELRINYDNNIAPDKVDFWYFLLTLLLFVVWIIFLAYYFQRCLGPLVGFLFTKLLRFMGYTGTIKIGSISASFIAGKIMFGNIRYVCDDFSLRVNDGYIIFSFWRYIQSRHINLKGDTSRLHVSLNGFHLNWYNRSSTYKEIARKFHLEKLFGDHLKTEPKRRPTKATLGDKKAEANWDRIWSFIGTIRLSVSSGKISMGNRLLPYMLLFTFENLESRAFLRESPKDRALLHIDSSTENFRASLIKHPEYEGEKVDEPPRTMGDGFALIQTAKLDIYYRDDQLGVETSDRQSPNENCPIWESVWRFGHNTVISYGPWAEAQRVKLWSFFNPLDYQTPSVTPMPARGEKRIKIKHDLRLVLLNETSIDLWFLRGEQLESMHTRCRAGSSLDSTIWWITQQNGFTVTTNLSLLNVVSTTSLIIRRLMQIETFSMGFEMTYPREYNAEQTWKINLRLSKATLWLVWDHKRFFNDLLDAWIGTDPPDIAKFIPYTVAFDFTVKDGFEIILWLNEGNWVDTQIGVQPEGVEAALVGDKLSFNFMMPFDDFLPDTVNINYKVKAEKDLALRIRVPPQSTLHPVLSSLIKLANVDRYAPPSNCGNISNDGNWFEIWRTEVAEVQLNHTYHPLPGDMHSDLPYHLIQEFSKNVSHPKDLPPDNLHVLIDVGGSMVLVAGLIVKLFMDLKNNYFGWYDQLTDVETAGKEIPVPGLFGKDKLKVEYYRPMDITLAVHVHNIRAHALLHTQNIDVRRSSYDGDAKDVCPIIFVEQLAVEMKKTMRETMVQVGVGSGVGYFSRSQTAEHDGFIDLSGLQFRGHAMFSPKDVPWDMYVNEYAWLMELIVGDVRARVQPAHLLQLSQFIDAFLLTCVSLDEHVRLPDRFNICQHGAHPERCKHKELARPCPSEEVLKYKSFRISMDSLKLEIFEHRTLLNIEVDPLRVSICNAHGGVYKETLLIRIPMVRIQQLVQADDDAHLWIEASKAAIEDISFDIVLPKSAEEQVDAAKIDEFLKKHDAETKRLFFLQNGRGCSCVGEARFFADEDTSGQIFLTTPPAPMAVKSVTDMKYQPAFLQSILRPASAMFIPMNHNVYTRRHSRVDFHKKSSIETVEFKSEVGSTASFYSAFSNTSSQYGRPIMERSELMKLYAAHLDQFEIAKTQMEMPILGSSGVLEDWRKRRNRNQKRVHKGLADLQLKSQEQHRQEMDDRTQPEEQKDAFLPPGITHEIFEIKGRAGNTAQIFITPLALEALDKILSHVTLAISELHPAFVAQCLYRSCMFKKHRQALTASLFDETKAKTISIIAECQIPTIHVCLFSCSQMENSRQNGSGILLLRMDDGYLNASITPTLGDPSIIVTFRRSGDLAAQYLRFIDKGTTDFAVQRLQQKNKTNWHEVELSKTMPKVSLRCLVDVFAPGLRLYYPSEEQNLGQVSGQKKLTVRMGKVDTMFIMARPLEVTARNEFPIFEALSPTVSAWFLANSRLEATVTKLGTQKGFAEDIKLLELLALALEEPTVLRVPKSCMGEVKPLYKNFSSCPSCQVTLALLRYTTACPSRAWPLPLEVRELKDEQTRKSAITALLSHWQTVVCKYIKLASNDEALKYLEVKEVQEADLDLLRMADKKGEATPTPKPKATQNSNPEAEHPDPPPAKLDLYQYVRRAHQQLKKEGKRLEPTHSKQEVNPMEISLFAFFYSFYRNCSLDVSFLDKIPLGMLDVELEGCLDEVLVNVVDHRLVLGQADKKFIAQATHPLIHLKKIHVKGKVKYVVEMDKPGLRPIGVKFDIDYALEVEHLRSVVAISCVCLIKELSLVALSIAEQHKLYFESRPTTPLTKKTPSVRRLSNISFSPSVNLKVAAEAQQEKQWIPGVVEKARAYQQTSKRKGMGLKRDALQIHFLGELLLNNARLEAILTDLRVAVALQQLSSKQEGTRRDAMHPPCEVSQISIQLRKAVLTILETEPRTLRPLPSASQTGSSVSPTPTNKHDAVKADQQHILHCDLHASHATVTRKLQSEGVPVETFVRLSLGAMEGDLPMSAHSLHDVVLRHGAQLEKQFDRLSAQPLATSTAGALSPWTTPLDEATPLSKEAIVQNPLKNGPARNVNLLAPKRIVKITFHFDIDKIELSCQLLPSLRMKYCIGRILSQGTTGDTAKWKAELAKHEVRFTVSTEDRPLPEHFTLALPKINVDGAYHAASQEGAPAKAKALLYREGGYLDVRIVLGTVDYTFTTDLLNQILFAEQSFRTELGFLVSRLRSSKPMPFAPGPINEYNQQPNKPLLFSLQVHGAEHHGIPWLQVTASTPTSTAVRVTFDNLRANLTNRWVVREAAGRERVFGSAEIQLSAKLGQLCKPAQFHEVAYELQEYASFMTQICVENKEGPANSNYSYLIALNRPILLIKSMAFDKAILLWLNYKNTYNYWRNERTKADKQRMRNQSARANVEEKPLVAMFSPPPGPSSATDINVNLSMSIQNGMYVCMPLIGAEVSDGMAALVMSLEKSDVTVCVKKQLACQASFKSFKVAFVDNYDDQSLSDTFLSKAGDSNYFYFPDGHYQFCSQASAEEQGLAEWVLSVRSQMQGMQIDLDQRIGRLAKMLVHTISSFGEEDDMGDEHYDQNNYAEVDICDEDVNGLEEAAELKKIQQPEGKIRWIERKMHEEAVRVFDLTQRKASEQELEAARKRLRGLELVRFRQFRKSMVEKWKRSRAQPAKFPQQAKNEAKMRRQQSRVMATNDGTVTVNPEAASSKETTVRMHIDIQVGIASGSCVLRTTPKEGQPPAVSGMSKKPSARDLRKGLLSNQSLNETKFSIPSVDVNGYYSSTDQTPNEPLALIEPTIHPSITLAHTQSSSLLVRPTPLNELKKLPSSTSRLTKEVESPNPHKRGCFYLSIALASMPEVTIVQPHLADFVEQVLEPLPTNKDSLFRSSSITTIPESTHSEDAGIPAPIVAIDTSTLPLDVVLSLTVQTSTIRFEGKQQRTSAADCILKLPCLTLLASTRRMESNLVESGGTALVLGGVDISITLSNFSLAIFSPHQQVTANDALSLTLDHLAIVISRSKNSSQELDNKVKFVLTANIGVASFNYDMRRLNELIAFPKPWYRAAIMRRVFFGDQSVRPRSPTNLSKERVGSRLSPVHRPRKTSVGAVGDGEKPWTATVQVALQWKELNVEAQIGNTMGKTTWRASNGVLRGSTRLNSSHERDASVLFHLDSSELVAHGGAVSGQIGFKRLRLSVTHGKKNGRPPSIHCRAQLTAISARIEWMSRAVLIAKCIAPSISICDDWKVDKDGPNVSRAAVSMALHGRWDDLELVVTRDTIDSLEKIADKLASFFREQLKSSKLAWGVMEERGRERTSESNDSDEKDPEKDAAVATRLWENVLDLLSGIQSRQKIFPLPNVPNGQTLAGGSVRFEAGAISLACMHGEMNAHSWALFHIKQPLILFSPEASFAYVDESANQVGISLRQRFVIRLGGEPGTSKADSLARVCRVQSPYDEVRQNATIEACLRYLISDVLHNVENGSTARGSQKVLELFQFPALEAVMTTIQMSPCTDNDALNAIMFVPKVRSRFTCAFQNAVSVQTDFNAQVTFLPELWNSYQSNLKENSPKKGNSSKPQATTSTSTMESKKDPRIFECELWQCDPKMRFIDRFRWDPPLIDEVLKKLQIFNHRTTIPKAIQKAVLDPLDVLLAVLLREMLSVVSKQ